LLEEILLEIYELKYKIFNAKYLKQDTKL